MSGNKLEDLDLTSDELSKIKKAFKDEQFRKLFAEYAEEISDPENRKKYEEEIAMLESQRGMDVKFVKPDPGYVLKTATIPDNVKAFVNICKNEHIEEARCNRQVGPDGKSGLNWSIPHSFAPVREDHDKRKGTCKVFDFVIHPNTYRMAETNERFMKMINDTAFSGVEKQFGIKLDKKNYKRPKMTFKGTPTATVIRTKQEGPVSEADPGDIMNQVKYPYSNKTSEEKAKELADKVATERLEKEAAGDTAEKDDVSEYQRPTCVIKHRSNIDLQNFTEARDSRPSTRPIELCIEIDLPMLKSASTVDLDIFEKKLKMSSDKPAKYRLELDLPYEVDESNGSAKFDKSKRKLVVTLPVVPLKVVQIVENGSADVDQNTGEATAESDCLSTKEPMIEILSSKEFPDSEGMDAASVSSKHSLEEVVSATDSHNNKTTHTTETCTADIFYAMPTFDYLQDDETVTFILDVKNVKKESVTKLFLDKHGKHCGFDLKLKSVGPGGFPMHFRFVVEFEECNFLDREACYIDIGEHNLVATLVKADDAIGPWEKFMVGGDAEKLEEKIFLSEHFVRRQLNGLDKEHDESEKQPKNMPELEVTDMNTSQLLLDVKECNGLSRSVSESAEDIEVVHEKQQPKLHGILKQRSRTTSESSDDLFHTSGTSPYGRQYSTGGESSPTPLTEESGDDSGESGGKKSVSFSEKVDQTLYKVNQSVTSMRSTLKNKRRKAQKKEKKQVDREKKRDARRRRNSNSLSEPSSDEPTTGESLTGETVKEDMEEEQQEVCVSDQVVQATHDTGLNSGSSQNGLEQHVTESNSGDAVKGTNGATGAEKSTSCDSRIPPKVNGVQNVSAEEDVNARTCDSDDDDDETCRMDSGRVPEVEEDAPPKADTVLSWNEGPSHAQSPRCAFQFSNNVMFELDLD